MEAKVKKSNARQSKKSVSLRVGHETKTKTDRKLEVANKKRCGRKIKADELLNLALDLVTEEHIKQLQEASLTNEDRRELLRQQYIETHGTISRDQFLGFMMTVEFQNFLKEHNSTQVIARPASKADGLAG
jgi:hypothetical protein